MEIELIPNTRSPKQTCGFVIRGESAFHWLVEIDRLGLELNQVQLFALPGNQANSVWGCLVLTQKDISPSINHINEMCYRIGSQLILTANSALYPNIGDKELDELFSKNLHLFHPTVGLFELTDPLDIAPLLQLPEEISIETRAPDEGIVQSDQIHSFQVFPPDAEDVFNDLVKDLSKPKGPIDKPLNLWEKGKLFFYRALFSSKGKDDKGRITVEKRKSSKLLEKIARALAPKRSNLAETMMNDFQDLERRNQKELDKLMDMLDSNPEEALKYAIPIDEHGTSRGQGDGEMPFLLSKMRHSLSLWNQGQYGNSSRTIHFEDHSIHALREKYLQAAQKLIAERKWEQAAFIYLKLLKDPSAAGSTLEQGGLYKEAAAIYIKQKTPHFNEKAAECYEKGRMYNEAIKYYQDLGRNEKVGDLYLKMNQTREAMHFYTLVLEDFASKDQFVKGAKLAKEKMNDFDRGQHLLLQGWREGKDGFNCLTYYLSHVDEKELMNSVSDLYKTEVVGKKIDLQRDFVNVLRTLHANADASSEDIKTLAYKIISENAEEDRTFASMLKNFEPEDKQLMKDAMRYRASRIRKSNP